MRSFLTSGNAFPCMTKLGCPEAKLKPGTKGFCPVWTETTVTEENIATGDTRFMRGCMFDVLPRLQEHTMKAANRPAAEIGKLRAEVAGSVVAAVTNFLMQADPELITAATSALEHAAKEAHAGNGADETEFRLKLSQSGD